MEQINTLLMILGMIDVVLIVIATIVLIISRATNHARN